MSDAKLLDRALDALTLAQRTLVDMGESGLLSPELSASTLDFADAIKAEHRAITDAAARKEQP